MNKTDFIRQVDRLLDVYGDRAFPKERLRLLWQASKDIHPSSFDSVISSVISRYTRNPTIEEISALIAENRESEHRKLKKFEKEQTKRWMASDQVSLIANAVRQVISGKADRKVMDLICDEMRNLANDIQPVRCLVCEDTGVWHKIEHGVMTPMECRHGAMENAMLKMQQRDIGNSNGNMQTVQDSQVQELREELQPF